MEHSATEELALKDREGAHNVRKPVPFLYRSDSTGLFCVLAQQSRDRNNDSHSRHGHDTRDR